VTIIVVDSLRNGTAFPFWFLAIALSLNPLNTGVSLLVKVLAFTMFVSLNTRIILVFGVNVN